MRSWKVFVLGAFLFIASGIALMFIGDKAHFLLWLYSCRTPIADWYFYIVTRLGEEIGFVIIGLMLWLISWRKMIFIPILGGTTSLVTYLMKEYFQHERPKVYLDRIGWQGSITVLDYEVLAGHASFPSGHSIAAWALFTLTAAMIRKMWVSVLCLFLAASVSVSRIYLMTHFLRDVLAGSAIGFTLGYLAYFFYDKWMKQRELVSTFQQAKSS